MQSIDGVANYNLILVYQLIITQMLDILYIIVEFV
jgi:hypothetical protein